MRPVWLFAEEAMITPPFTVSNKIPVTTSPATFRKQVLAGKRLIGVNVTDGGCAPSDPVAAAKLLASYGVNWVRLHHIDRGLVEGWWTVDQILAFMDAGVQNGIRFSVDGCSKLGELYSGDFKKDLYEGVDAAKTLYLKNVDRITPILKHRGCWGLCLVNEPANRLSHETGPELVKAFFQEMAPIFRAINPLLALTDASDAWAQFDHPSPYAEAASLYDWLSIHDYNGGEDFGPSGKGSWVGEGWPTWKIRLFVGRTRELAGRFVPVMIQEFASYNVNRFYVANEIFIQTIAALEGWSTCQFAFATNQDCWDGKGQDVYATVTDASRLKTLLYGAYLLKNQTGLALDHWDGTLGKWGPNIKVSGSRVSMDQNNARVNSYVWNLQTCPDWARLTKVV